MRGDRPPAYDFRTTGPEFTPHARGSTAEILSLAGALSVYPACAGIDRIIPTDKGYKVRLPRMRGDRPEVRDWLGLSPKFTPHARGSTQIHIRDTEPSAVYPACAGIDLFSYLHYSDNSCLPRMRGDRPIVSGE